MNDKNFQRLILIVQIATVFLFLGRSWQHLFWDAPFRTLLWDEAWMKGIVETVFNTSWKNYITSNDIDFKIQTFIKGLGWFYLLCALMAVFIQKWKKVSGVFMILGAASLVFLAALYCKERFFSVGQFFEFSIQFSTPVLLYLMVKKGEFNERIVLFLKIIIALTFVCHGLYAINYYPRPGLFTEMTINILGISETGAEHFLKLAGVFDFIIGIGIFLPFRFSKYILIYAILWGFMTTIARVWANVYLDFFWESLHQWWFEAAYRVPHFLIPLTLFLFLKQKYRTIEDYKPKI
jgi:hypothetical protein